MPHEMPRYPPDPPQFLTYCPRRYGWHELYKFHNTLGQAKNAVQMHRYGTIWQWDPVRLMFQQLYIVEPGDTVMPWKNEG